MDPTITAAIVSPLTAVLVVFAGHMVNRRRREREMEKLELEISQIRDQASRSEARASIAEDKAEAALRLSQGEEMYGAGDMFIKMNELIGHYIVEQEAAGVDRPVVSLKLLAVSMTYSWDGYITSGLVRLLTDKPHVVVHLDALIVDHAHLESKNLGIHATDWAKRSRQHSADAEAFVANQCPRFGDGFEFRLHSYRNIPHWHGWLVNDKHLFLGRTRWEDSAGMPILFVGTNEYRYYDDREQRGEKRVQLFKSWHSYYMTYDSAQVCRFPRAQDERSMKS